MTVEAQHLSDVRRLPESKRLAAYRGLLARGNRYSDSLANRITAGVDLSDAEAESLADLLGKGCHGKTKRRLHTVCRFIVHRGESCGLYERLTFDHVGPNLVGAFYCAGQSYPDEIRRLRALVLG